MAHSTIGSANKFILARSIIESPAIRGEHAPITIATCARKCRSEAQLLGRIFDDSGNRMSLIYAIKKGARYCSYLSCVVQQRRKEDADSVPRVAAQDVEGIVMNTLAALLPPERSQSAKT